MSAPSSRKLAQEWPYARHEEFVKTLREAAAKWFEAHNQETHSRMPYCLAKHELWEHNILCRDVIAYIHEERKSLLGESPFILHKYVHHGLSSQAMAFNLLGPLIVRKDFAPLEAALAKIGIKWAGGKGAKARFEYEDRSVFNEDVGQPTSIDLCLESEGGDCLFIEAKLSEKEFGGCSIFAGGDCEGRNPYPGRLGCCYLHHIGREYWQKFDELEFFKSHIANGEICPFANYYQFFREVLFALHQNGTFILLHDERNPAFLRRADDGTVQGGLWPFLYEAIPPRWQNRVGRLSIQSLVEEIGKSGRHNDWIGEFKAKYGME